MLISLGFVIILGSVFGGFVMAGGALGPLYQPMEIVMICGAAVGAFVAGNNGKAITATFRTFSRLKRTNKYNKSMYMELMALQYRLLSKMRREGVLGIEADVEEPDKSPLFAEYPRILGDTMIMSFITDYLRLMIGGSMDPLELDELMNHEIESFEREAHIPSDALGRVGDALPAFGIVVAVMGVVKALGSADAGAEQVGQMVAHALVGTFLGILLAYGFINPLASRIEHQVSEAIKMLQCMRVTLLASLNGYAPQLAVEFGRKALHAAERPSFTELEDHVRSVKNAEGSTA
ncbi:MAG: flagellar motor stator protein MotA [Pseudohongiellaceae bacterium]